MNNEMEKTSNQEVCIQQNVDSERYLNPNDVSVPPGYLVEIFAQGLNTPIGMAITEKGELLIADDGILTGNPKVILLSNGAFTIIAEGFNVPITGITYRYGDIYVSHRGVISIVKLDGSRRDIISGLPSYGDYSNNKVDFGEDGKMYFGQGTATNSGVVGLDNDWVLKYAFFNDQMGSYIMLNGQNYETKNMLIPAGENVLTGAFSPYGVPNLQTFEIIKGTIRASGSVLKANPDGSGLELVAWGFRNPYVVKYDRFNRLFVTNQGYEVRGSRPIANTPDVINIIIPGTWYGWPDYAGGELVTLPRFATTDGPQPEILFTNRPSVPPSPFSIFLPYSNIMGLDFNNNPEFGRLNDMYIAEFGGVEKSISGVEIRSGVGHRVTKVDMNTGQTVTFAINKSGFPAFIDQGGGFSRPTDVIFGLDGAMYVSDYAIAPEENPYDYIQNTGVIWRISKI
ncbi:MAG: PQQ-dependent sugar dehydrogenase [Mobilitalea sp.]